MQLTPIRMHVLSNQNSSRSIDDCNTDKYQSLAQLDTDINFITKKKLTNITIISRVSGTPEKI